MVTWNDMLVTSRRRMLLNALTSHGVEHFVQESWFTGPGSPWWFGEDPAWGLANPGAADSRRIAMAQYDVDDCGAAACLAGHGALVMHSIGHDAASLSPRRVAQFFKVPETWFAEHLRDDHLGMTDERNELADDIYDRGEDEYVSDDPDGPDELIFIYYEAQVAALKQLIEEGTA